MTKSKTLTQTEIKNVLEKKLGKLVQFAYLLGSAGTPRFHAESDIDLAVFWKRVPPYEKLSKIRSDLNDSLNTEIDLVSLNAIDPIFGRQVLETGRLLIEKSPGIHLKWKSDQLSRYPDFKFSRKVIEDGILNRKKYV